MNTTTQEKRASFRTIIRRCAGCGVLLVSLAYAGHGARAQQEQQNPPATQTTPADQNAQPANTQSPTQNEPAVWSGQPAVVVQPRPGTQPKDDAVHATGGIINSHPEDILNRPGDYTAPAPLPASPEPAPPVIPASNLSELNQTPDSVQYADRVRGPYRLTIEESGVWSDNLFDVHKGQINGAYFDTAIPVGLQKNNERTTYGIFYRPDYTVFPQYSQLNHFSQIFSQQLNHKVSDLTDVSWNLAGGRVVTTGQYIPSTITVGSTTVVTQVSSNALEYTDNIATNLGMTRRLDERDAVAISATGGWIEQPEGAGDQTHKAFIDRSEMGGIDLHFTRLMSPRSVVGIEANDIYVRGLAPVGHSNFATLKGTFTTMLSPHVSLALGAGPLYGKTAVSLSPFVATPQGSLLSYSADAGINYQTSFGKISAGYDRSLEIGYLGGTLPTNSFYGVFDRPLSQRLDLVVDTSYGRTSNGPSSGTSSGSNLSYSAFGVTSRLSDYITPNISAFIQASHFQQDAPGSFSNSFNRSDVSGGITYSFGIPLTRRGDRP